MNILEALERAAQRAENDDDGPKRPKMTKVDPVAQAMELRDRWNSYNVEHDLRPGMLVRAKHRVGPLKDDYRIVLLVMRRLTDSTHDKLLVQDFVRTGQLASTAFPPDLVCADILRSGGGALALDLYDSRTLEPVSDAELESWQAPRE